MSLPAGAACSGALGLAPALTLPRGAAGPPRRVAAAGRRRRVGRRGARHPRAAPAARRPLRGRLPGDTPAGCMPARFVFSSQDVLSHGAIRLAPSRLPALRQGTPVRHQQPAAPGRPACPLARYVCVDARASWRRSCWCWTIGSSSGGPARAPRAAWRCTPRRPRSCATWASPWTCARPPAAAPPDAGHAGDDGVLLCQGQTLHAHLCSSVQWSFVPGGRVAWYRVCSRMQWKKIDKKKLLRLALSTR